ncbi:uncharacterized protein LOC131429311 [Malaya genurostris]|uniref:uncharacterized protein LOC131429311 n=1 Tax=Malaya genurostris TaxID=325434 RepID=UPI0026F3C9F1|nr:uncharacterized protein LOC131429311 [Malaya genurostris]
MVARCSASFCRQELGAGVTWFLFPPQHHRKCIWMKRLQVTEDPKRPYMLACRKHFSEAQFRNSVSGKQLVSDAVPDMFVAEDDDEEEEDEECNEDISLPDRRDRIPEIENVSYNGVCRFCLKKNINVRSLFPDHKDEEIPSPLVIWQTVGINIDPDDNLPHGICEDCLRMIESIKRIRDRFQVIDRKLRQNYVLAVEEANDMESTTESRVNGESEQSNILLLEVFENTATTDGQTEEQLLTSDQITIVEVDDMRFDNYSVLAKGSTTSARQVAKNGLELKPSVKRRRRGDQFATN